MSSQRSPTFLVPLLRSTAYCLAALTMALSEQACSRNGGQMTPTEHRADSTNAPTNVALGTPTMTDTKTYKKPAEEVLRQQLSPLEYEVTQRNATEPAFRNKYWNNHEAGLYVDITTGEPLFSSTDKFDSGTGWPSFTRPVDPRHVLSVNDRSHGMTRTEVRSRDGNAHLGHVFEDGPAPGGVRYCINSASLRFIPVDRLQAEGYGNYLALFSKNARAQGETRVQTDASAQAASTANSCTMPTDSQPAGCQSTLETAILAGGCFWGMEELLRKIPGVLETEVGYTGGNTVQPNYPAVKSGRTGHAEAVRIVFDPTKVSYAELLEQWFFRMHDPTTKDRQGNDVGTQYRSAIFFTSAEQRQVASDVIKRVNQSGRWKTPVVTEVVEAGAFTAAEDYHQDYLEKNPGGYTCHFMRE